MSMQMVELLYKEPRSLDAKSIAERSEDLLGSGIDIPEQEKESDSVHFFHQNSLLELKDGSIPAQTVILDPDNAHVLEKGDAEHYTEEIEQSWSCEDAAKRIERCKASRLVSEFMCIGLEPSERVRLFHGVLQATVETTEPHALVFKHSMQIVSPEHYLDSCGEPPIQRPGALNVRFFNIANSDGDMIMDTRGLEEIGLHDFQCHYKNLDPNDVGVYLFGMAMYIFENGPVIDSGHTVEGLEPGSQWKCQFENSILEPKRALVDLNPGNPFAAGDR